MKINKAKPLFDHIITTADKYEVTQTKEGVLTDESKMAGNIKEYQKVLAIGPFVKDINVGDMVLINPTRYGRPKHRERTDSIKYLNDETEMIYQFPILEINDKECLFISSNDIDLVIEDYSE